MGALNMSVISLWRRRPRSESSLYTTSKTRFNAAQASLIATQTDLLAMQPGIVRPLSARFDVQDLVDRICPVLLSDDTVAILATPDHVGSDHADELARRIALPDRDPSTVVRYAISASLLLDLTRGGLDAQGSIPEKNSRTEQVRTALAAIFQDLVEWGVRYSASDLHLNVLWDAPYSEIKYTLAGHYVAPACFRHIASRQLLDVLAVAWMDIRGGNGAVFDPGKEQQGSLLRYVQGKKVLLRWASLAADDGPSVCLRFLQRDAIQDGADMLELGYTQEQVSQFKRACMTDGGAVIFAGMVGSGKSTSLATLIAGLPPHRKTITIEDPVEYRIPGAIQNTVIRDLDTDAQDAFAAKLRAIKRAAMNDVLLGEIRDDETGRAFMDLVGSGVNVYTTVHASSASLIPSRLASDFIRISPDFLASPGMLKLLVYQVLLPVLCAQCSLPMNTVELDDVYGISFAAARTGMALLYPDEDAASLRGRNLQGCDACRRQGLPELNGYAGRTVAAEIIEPGNQQAQTAWSTKQAGFHYALHEATSAYGSDIVDMAAAKAFRGLIDPRDIARRFSAFQHVLTSDRMAAFPNVGSKNARVKT
jgi:general secretion pathway protein E